MSNKLFGKATGSGAKVLRIWKDPTIEEGAIITEEDGVLSLRISIEFQSFGRALVNGDTQGSAGEIGT